MGGAWSNTGIGGGDDIEGGARLDEVLRSIQIEAAIRAGRQSPSAVLTPLQSAYLANKQFQTLQPRRQITGQGPDAVSYLQTRVGRTNAVSALATLGSTYLEGVNESFKNPLSVSAIKSQFRLRKVNPTTLTLVSRYTPEQQAVVKQQAIDYEEPEDLGGLLGPTTTQTAMGGQVEGPSCNIQ